MGGVLVECSQTQTQTIQQVVVLENNSNKNVESNSSNSSKDSNKKKKRRSRRSKQNFSLSGSSSVTELCAADAQDSVVEVPSEQNQLPKASDIAFNSMPTMHVNNESAALPSPSNQLLYPFDDSVRVFSKSCPDAFIVGEESAVGSHTNRDFVLSHNYCPRKYFAPHWSSEAVDRAIEKGYVFKALFRVNAHNRLEAYCKIEGVQTDVLISGVVAQNRAVEGDTVAIKIDPPSMWTRMKGVAGTVNCPAAGDDCVQAEDADIVQDSCKGKVKADAEYEYGCSRNLLLPKESEFHNGNGTCSGEIVYQEPMAPLGNICGSEHSPSVLESLGIGTSVQEHGPVTSAMKLNAIVSSFPSKRPTGKVVSINEMSPRRGTVIGFLSVKQLFCSREINKKDFKKNKHQAVASSHEYVLLTPTDPKFPKMKVPLRSLPTYIKKRLESGDGTIEMDLVAARIVEWGEESNMPEAEVIHVFGRGGDVESQIAAILFENAIDASEFSPAVLSCLPNTPWEIPQEEFDIRRDLRSMCIFTIDPATASDLDDALSVQELSDGHFRVGVHIADVSYFVQPNTALDIDAHIRSTSIYLLQRKLPMLPPLLSDSVGSLNPGVDRLAFSMFWDINCAGEVVDRWIGRTVIQSCCKLSYEHAQDIIDGLFDAQNDTAVGCNRPPLHGHVEWPDVVTSVKSLYRISKVLKENRFKDGALSLESPKVVFLFDEDGFPYDTVLSGRKESNFLVEEFMLLANRTAAEVITRAYPSSSLLRRHPGPNLRKLKEFQSFCSKHGLKLDTSSSLQLRRSLEHIRGELKNDYMLFDILMSYASRPMQLAAYICTGASEDDDGDWGHFALAVPLYTHFTSPLRRYPDIVVHRTLAATIEAEEMYLKYLSSRNSNSNGNTSRWLTGIWFSKDAIESHEAQEALRYSASKFRIPCSDTLADVAAHCNERKLASRHVKDAIDKLYMWALLKKKEILISEARVLGLGPKFMQIYIHKLAIERRIYYDEIDGLTVEWLETTSTLVLSQAMHKRFNRRSYPGKYKALEEVALVVSPCDLKPELDLPRGKEEEYLQEPVSDSSVSYITDAEPAVLPLTLCLLSTIPVALHAVGGDDGPLDIAARLYVSTYFS